MTASTNTPPRTPPRISAKEASFATITVGVSQSKFVVHEDLLTYHSHFFRAALTGHFKEAENKTVILGEEDPQVFEFFVHWLYHQRLPNKDDAPDLFNAWDCEGDRGGLKTGNLISLHVLCDTYDVQALKAHTLNEMFAHLEHHVTGLPNSEQVSVAFDRLLPDSALCRYLVDVHCCYAEDNVWDDLEAAGFPWAFLTAVMKRYTLFARGDLYHDSCPELCDYHEHQDQAERAVCIAEGLIGGSLEI